MITEKQLRSLKPQDKKYTVYDSDGLLLEIRPTGTGSWFYRTRSEENGAMKAKKQKLGDYPEMSLYAARMARDKAKGEKVRKEGGEYTFRELAEEWYRVKCVPSVSPKCARTNKARLDMYVYPAIGDTLTTDVTAEKVLTLLRSIEALGWKDVPHDVCQQIGRILRFGIISGKAERDVTQDLRGALKTSRAVHYPSMQTPEGIGELMRDLWSLPDGSVKRLLLFTAYTFVRPTEARLASWDEFPDGLTEWRLPAERMKMRRPHVVPLSRQAREIIQQAEPCRGLSKWVFPAPRNTSSALANMACLVALRRLGYTGDRQTVHGFRSIASTTLYEHGWLGSAIERQLAHSDSNSVRAAYNYAEHLDVRRPMMQWYADYLDALRDGTPVPEKSR